LALKAEYRKKLQGSFDVLLKDGRWIRTTDRALTNGGFVSVQIEITDQKQAEKTLQENERHLDTLVRTSPAVIYSVDLKTDLSLSFVSQKIETIFGYTVADCMSEQNFWKNRLHPDEADAVVQTMLDNIANTDSSSDETGFVCLTARTVGSKTETTSSMTMMDRRSSLLEPGLILPTEKPLSLH